jgi:hypothetical protein
MRDADGEIVGLRTPETAATEYDEVRLWFQDDESPRYIVSLNPAPGGPLTQPFQQQGNERFVLAPTHDLVLRITHRDTADDTLAAPFHVQVFQGHDGQLLQEQEIHQTEALAVDGLTLQVETQRYVILTLGQDPGLPLALLGILGSLSGLILLLLRPTQRLSLVVQVIGGQVTLFLASAPQNLRDSGWFAQTAQLLATEMGFEHGDLSADSEPAAPVSSAP